MEAESARLRVNLKREIDNSYDIRIGRRIVDSIDGWLEENLQGRRPAIITDSVVTAFAGERLLGILGRHHPQSMLFSFYAGEESKTRTTKGRLEDEMLQHNYGRDTFLFALGGGVVGDLAGYLAATFQRGVGWAQIPTTLLAMVDSSIGGKTGVDTQHGKNLIGAFYQPEMVFIDPDLLETLPLEHRKAGFAEIIKHGVIADEKYFASLEEHHREILELESPYIDQTILGSCEIKSRVVETDEKEAGLRAILNFGHTVGHAIEKLADFQLLHGEAIAVGMRYEAKLAVRLGLMAEADESRLNRLLDEVGYPKSIAEIPKLATHAQYPEVLVKAMRADKKNKNGKIRPVLPKTIGEMATTDPGSYTIEVDEKTLADLFR